MKGATSRHAVDPVAMRTFGARGGANLVSVAVLAAPAPVIGLGRIVLRLVFSGLGA